MKFPTKANPSQEDIIHDFDTIDSTNEVEGARDEWREDPSPETQCEYASCLVSGFSDFEQEMGIDLLKDVLSDPSSAKLVIKKAYNMLCFAYYRQGNFPVASQYSLDCLGKFAEDDVSQHIYNIIEIKKIEVRTRVDVPNKVSSPRAQKREDSEVQTLLRKVVRKASMTTMRLEEIFSNVDAPDSIYDGSMVDETDDLFADINALIMPVEETDERIISQNSGKAKARVNLTNSRGNLPRSNSNSATVSPSSSGTWSSPKLTSSQDIASPSSSASSPTPLTKETQKTDKEDWNPFGLPDTGSKPRVTVKEEMKKLDSPVTLKNEPKLEQNPTVKVSETKQPETFQHVDVVDDNDNDNDDDDDDEEILPCSFCKKDFKTSLLADFSARKLCAGCMKLILNRMQQKEAEPKKEPKRNIYSIKTTTGKVGTVTSAQKLLEALASYQEIPQRVFFNSVRPSRETKQENDLLLVELNKLFPI